MTACDRFIYVENLGDTPEGQVQRTQSKRPLGAETLLLLREVIADCSDDDGWAELSEVGGMLSPAPHVNQVSQCESIGR